MIETSLIQTNESILLPSQELMNAAFDFANDATAKNTQRTYRFGWNSFCKWCESQSIDPLTVKEKEALVAFYISDKASKGTLKVSSITCYLAAICHHYLERNIIINMKHPSILKVLKGIRRRLTTRPVQKEPILTEDLREMVHAIPSEKDGKHNLQGIRDKAILLVGFAGAFRRSELVGLDLEDITFTRDGFVALIRRSKTDQEGGGVEKAIPYGASPLTCPVRAMKDWIDISGVTSGPIFRAINKHGQIQQRRLTGRSIPLIIKRSPHIIEKQERFSGHSLRAGFVTSAAKRNVPEDLIMRQTGHKSSNTVKMYIRRGKRFEENAATLVGL